MLLKMAPANCRPAMLAYGVGADLHEAVLATGFHHAVQQAVQLHRVGRGVRGRHLLLPYPIDNRGEHARGIAHIGEQAVQQRNRSSLAIGASDAHQLQLAAGMVIERRRHQAQRHGAVRHLHEGHLRRQVFRHGFANNHATALFDGLRDVEMPVGERAALRHVYLRDTRSVRGLNLTRVEGDTGNLPLRASGEFVPFYGFQQCG